MYPVTFNRLESLSNELLLEIFEYLDAYNLCQAFYGLNHRINTLLQSAHLHILYDSSNENKTVWDTLTSFFYPSQIRILSSYNNIDIHEQFVSSTKENLRSVRLNGMNQEHMDKIFQLFSSDNKIKCLYLTENWDYSGTKAHSLIELLFFNNAHRFTALVNLSLSPFHYTYMRDFPIVSVSFLQLRHLSINKCYWTTNLIRFFQDNTPNLRSLKFLGHYDLSNPPTKFIIKHIHELHMNYPNFLAALEGILSMFPCLRRLRIDWEYRPWNPVFDGNQWQELIEKYLPQLKQLTIDFDPGIDEEIVKSFYIGEFWSTRKVNVKMIINKTESRYRLVKTIYFGKQWHFGYLDNF